MPAAFAQSPEVGDGYSIWGAGDDVEAEPVGAELDAVPGSSNFGTEASE